MEEFELVIRVSKDNKLFPILDKARNNGVLDNLALSSLDKFLEPELSVKEVLARLDKIDELQNKIRELEGRLNEERNKNRSGNSHEIVTELLGTLKSMAESIEKVSVRSVECMAEIEKNQTHTIEYVQVPHVEQQMKKSISLAHEEEKQEQKEQEQKEQEEPQEDDPFANFNMDDDEDEGEGQKSLDLGKAISLNKKMSGGD